MAGKNGDSARAGCDLAVTESAPGSASQRNMERLGFRIAYTRVDLVAPWHAEGGEPSCVQTT